MMKKKTRAIKVYPNWVRIQALSNGSFSVYVHEQENPRRPDVYEAKNAEELLELLMGIYEGLAVAE